MKVKADTLFYGGKIYTMEAPGVCKEAVVLKDGKKIKVKVPAGTQDGKVLTIKGKGAPDLKNKGQFGNLKIQIHVEVPTDMNDEQKKAMEGFLAATGEEKRPWA